MRRQPKPSKIILRFDPLEDRRLMSVSPDGPMPTGPIMLGPPRPAGSPELIAIIDSGIDTTSTDATHFTGNPGLLDFTDAYNAVSGSYGQSSVADPLPNSQGTRVANYVAQGIADAEAAGGSSNVQVVPIKAYDKASDGTPFYAVVNGIYHAIDIGAKVIDLGFSASSAILDPGDVQQLEAALQDASASGVVVTVAAGDNFNANGTGAGLSLDQLAGYADEYPEIFHQSNMLVTTATDSAGNVGGASNYGAIHVDVGVPIPFADRITSFASAYASGVAGVVAATRTDWSAVQIVNHLKQTSQAEPALANKTTTGAILVASRALSGIYGVVATTTPGAYDGGLKTDFGLYGNFPGSGYTFQLATASQGYESAYPTIVTNSGYGFGGPGSIPVPGNYYGTGLTQPAIYGPEIGPNGQPDGKYDFAILTANAQGQYAVTTFVQGIGGASDVPVVADFSGSGKDDFALYGLHNGEYNFEVLTAASGFSTSQVTYLDNNGQGFGGPGSIPVVGDFFGDGKDDPAVFGPDLNASGVATGTYDFAALDSGSRNAQGYYTNSLLRRGFGYPGVIPIVGDYDGDGKDDLALYGKLYGQYQFVVLTSSSNFNLDKLLILNNGGQGFGGPGSIPVAGDFDGDGTTDPAVYGPELNASGLSDGNYNFAYLTSKSRYTQGQAVNHFGSSSTVSVIASPFTRWYESHFD